MPDTEYDADGRITGYGLTLNPTAHRYETDGRTLYTWCALDTLIFPAVLGHTARVTSPCRATGEPVRLTVAPQGPTGVDPPTAAVSLPAGQAPVSLRTGFCNEIHFFTGAETAGDWLAGHPGSRVLSAAEAPRPGTAARPADPHRRHRPVRLLLSAEPLSMRGAGPGRAAGPR
ncbi:organomercurial lyase [Streptomyces sp. YIM 98790]|uniref:organomercurial lyase n=1 Tax=Streptomyces sp. YIM 98790 TaxID=2689077 RepID=UPI001A9F510A|nr:organomercurial lyase [Streptomyces sp. YIM 98790]